VLSLEKKREEEEESETMSQLIVLGRNGGKQEYQWSPEKVGSVRSAQKIFEEKLEEGYAAFKIFRASSSSKRSSTSVQVSQQQEQELLTPTIQQTVMGEQIHEFDSRAETIQMTPPMVGG